LNMFSMPLVWTYYPFSVSMIYVWYFNGIPSVFHVTFILLEIFFPLFSSACSNKLDDIRHIQGGMALDCMLQYIYLVFQPWCYVFSLVQPSRKTLNWVF
jgi:hypothetical protein